MTAFLRPRFWKPLIDDSRADLPGSALGTGGGPPDGGGGGPTGGGGGGPLMLQRREERYLAVFRSIAIFVKLIELRRDGVTQIRRTVLCVYLCVCVMRLRQALEGLLAVTAVLLFLLVYLSVTNPNSSDCYASFNNAELMHHPFFVPMLKSLLAEVGKLPTASKMLPPTSSSSSTISHHVSVTDCGIPSFARLGRSYDTATLMNTFRTLIRIENERWYM